MAKNSIDNTRRTRTRRDFSSGPGVWMVGSDRCFELFCRALRHCAPFGGSALRRETTGQVEMSASS